MGLGLSVLCMAPLTIGAAVAGAGAYLWRQHILTEARRGAWQSSLDKQQETGGYHRSMQQLRLPAPAERAARAIANLTASLKTAPLSAARPAPTLSITDAPATTAASLPGNNMPTLPSDSSMGHSTDPSGKSRSVRGTKRTSDAAAPGQSSEEASEVRPKVPRTAAQEANDAALLAVPLPWQEAIRLLLLETCPSLNKYPLLLLAHP